MKKAISGILAVCAAIGWWGFLYPQFSLLEGTYRVVNEEPAAKSDQTVTESELDSSELYWSILDADSGRVRFKSRLLTEWREFHESGNQQ